MLLKFPQHILFLILSLLFSISTAYATSFTVGGVRINKDLKTMTEIKQQHIVRQSLDFSCGAAGLSTLLNFYLGDPISEQEIINTMLHSVELAKVKERRGFSLFDLKTFAQSRGYKVTGYKDLSGKFLADLKKPVLVPIKLRNYRHFVIVKTIVNDRAFISDPAIGNISMKVDQFEKLWVNGIGLLVEKEGVDTTNNPLTSNEEHLIVADYKHIARSLNESAIRTAVYSTEWD